MASRSYLRQCAVIWVTAVLFCHAQNPDSGDLDHQTGHWPHRLSLVLAANDDAAVLTAALRFANRCGDPWRPRVVTLEPGPLILRQGLKLLPNEVLPRTTPPDLLAVSVLGELEVTNSLLALIRRCLMEGRQVWIVGPRFPEPLAEMRLEPGQIIERVDLAQLEARLSNAFEAPGADPTIDDFHRLP